MRRAIINDATGEVVNVVVLPDKWTPRDTSWTVPDGHSLADITHAAPGDRWDGNALTKAEPRPQPLTDQQKIDALIDAQAGDDSALRAILAGRSKG